MAWEVPCLVAAGVQLTVANASTQPIRPAPSSAIKGEYPDLQQNKTFPSRTLLWMLDSIKVVSVSPPSVSHVWQA